MQNTTKKKRGAVLSALAVAAFLIAYIVFIVLAVLYTDADAVALILIYAVLIGAPIVGVFFALRQRLKEIDRGEEEDAKQY